MSQPLSPDAARALEKIKKLLALANDARGNEQERATALRQAQALMAKHALSDGAVTAASCAHQAIRSAFSATRPKDYESALFALVARAFGCEVLWTSGWSAAPTADGCFGRFTFIGPKTHLELAVYTVTFLQRELVKGRVAFVAAQHARGLTGRAATPGADGYCQGWVTAVAKVLDTFADPDGTVRAARLAYKAQTFNLDGSAKVANVQKRRGTTDGWSAGNSDGARVQLRRGVGGVADRPALEA